MNNELRPYDEYKKAKQEWLNIIPTHWKQAKSKRLYNETSIKNCENEELLSATQDRGVIPRSMLNTRVVMPSGNLNTFKLVQEGNFVISLRSFQGGLEYSKYRGIVSPAYNILEQKSKQNPMYYKHLFKSHDFIGELQRNVTGIRQGKNIDVNDFKEIILPLPPIEEQEQIVKYLDFQLAKINKFIKVKKKLIAALKEQKQAVINEAVTKGINPNAKMKPCVVELLGNIPDEWSIRKLKQITISIGDGLHGTPIYDKNGTYYFINGNNLGEKYLKFNQKTNMIAEEEYQKYRVQLNENSILISLNGTIGSLSFYNNEPVILSKSAGYINLKSNMNKNYIYYFLQSDYVKKYFDLSYSGTTINNLSLDTLRNTKVTFPQLIEQNEIVKFIETKTKVIDIAISTTQKEIEFITEYRTSLISDVVTGKVDVRHIEIDDIIEEDTEIDETDDEEIDTEEILDGEAE